MFEYPIIMKHQLLSAILHGFQKPRTDLPRNKPVTYQGGKFEVPHLGQWYANLNDPYYVFITIPWPGFIILIVGAYILLNIFFALLFLLGGDCINNASPGSFLDAFFFSVQSFGSIGYGDLTPATRYANTVVTIEAITSILSISLITGLSYARFARPTARVTFSNVMVVSLFDEAPRLQFRAVNRRHNQIFEAKASLHLMIDETSPEGIVVRGLYDLPLIQPKIPSLVISWTIIHKISPDSPLALETVESLTAKRAMFLVSLQGIDETGQTVLARMVYGMPAVQWGAQFVDILETDEQGNRCFNFSHFHEYKPANPSAMQQEPSSSAAASRE